MMATIVGIKLLIAVVIVVSLPFIPVGRRVKTRYLSDNINQLLAKRDRLYEEMRMLELDHELGTLDYEDYNSLINSLRIEAAKLIQKQNELQANDLNDVLESEIKAFRDSIPFNKDYDPPKI